MLIPNKKYDFMTIDPVELGSNYKNMEVIAILSHTKALGYRDIYSLHEKLQRKLEQKIDIEDMTYYLFKSSDGNEILLPNEYIVADSVKEVSTIKIVVEIPDAKVTDISLLNETLTSLGFYGCKIKRQ